MLQLINKGQMTKFKTATKSRLLLVAVFCFFIFLFTPYLVLGQEETTQPTTAQPELDLGMAYAEQTGLPTTDIRLIIANIIRVALGLLGLIAVIIILYGGWLWMSAGGNEDQVAKAKKTLINGTIGLIIILSAYSIVVFVMRMLGIGDYGGGVIESEYAQRQQSIMTISGSGAWGKAILDHYPVPNQIDVPRNTKIAITFAKPIRFDSVATEISENVFDLKKDVIKISGFIPSSTATGSFDLIPHAGDFRVYKFPIETTTPSGETKMEIFTIVVEPQNWLGDSDKNIRYLVRIEPTLLNEDGKSIFVNLPSKFYQWYFTCSMVADNDPPRVIDVYPGAGEEAPKNATIQITFNEPIFPNGQVSFDDAGGYYKDKVNSDPMVFIKSNSSTVPLGTFKITNQYRTLEFSSSIACGTNACGNPYYCLPVCDKHNCDKDNYQVVFKTAPATSDSNKPKFSVDMSSPLKGIMDMSGNAMDAGNFGVYDRNTVSPFTTGFTNFDNYGWSFVVTKEMDTISPYIRKLSIGPETETVLANENMSIAWSKRMKLGTLYKIEINEYPDPQKRCDILKDPPYNVPKGMCSLDTLGKSPFSVNEFTNGFGTSTVTQILHTPFLDGFPQNYIPEITSVVEDINGNCYYPGSGPGNQGRNVSCMEPGCCNGPYCCNGVEYENPFGGTFTEECRKFLTGSAVGAQLKTLPDLIIEGIDFITSLGNNRVKIIIKNNSNVSINKDFRVTMYTAYKSSPDNELREPQVVSGGLEGYGTKELFYEVNPSVASLLASLRVYVDSGGEITEVDESNNELKVVEFPGEFLKSCWDTDGGINFGVKGEKTSYNGDKVVDVCMGGTMLWEHACPEVLPFGFITTTCENGCSDGACL